MTETAQTHRPSPRPSPAGVPARPVDGARLHVVPPPADPQPEVPTSDVEEGASTETITAGQSRSPDETVVTTSDLGFRVRISGVWAATRAYWTPPAVFTERPPSLEALAEYAKQAPWTHQQTGIIRALGVGYYRYFAYPYTVVSRYREWFAQRPLRLAPLLGAIKLVSLTGPGSWAVDHIVYPVARLAGHIFL